MSGLALCDSRRDRRLKGCFMVLRDLYLNKVTLTQGEENYSSPGRY
jgi:hypothetical protein